MTGRKNGGRRGVLKKVQRILILLAVCAAMAAGLMFFNENYVVYNSSVYGVKTSSLDLRDRDDLNIDALMRFDSLESIDLRGASVSVEQFEELSQKLPDCEMLWSVPLSFGSVDSDSAVLDFSAAVQEDFDLLGYFPALQRVDASGCKLYDVIMEHSEKLPDCEFIWSVDIGQKSYASDCTELTVGDISAQELEKLRYLPALKSVDASGCTHYETLCALQKAMPECTFKWTVQMLGKSYDNYTEEIDISGTKVEDLDALKAALVGLPSLKKLVMCNCGLSNETLASLREEFPNVKVVWRIYFGIWSMRTDAKVFSTLNMDEGGYMLTDAEAQVFKYCTDLELLDLGHNALTSVEPFAHLTNMKVLILADNRISDISPLAGMTELVWLEMFINRVSDISVLKNMPNLTHVNFCWNRVSDPSPLYELKDPKYIWMCGCYLSGAKKRQLIADFPDCQFDLDSGRGSTNGKWRQNDTYYKVYRAFNYNNGSTTYEWE